MTLEEQTEMKFCLHKVELMSLHFCQDQATHFRLLHNIKTPKALQQTTSHIVAAIFMYLFWQMINIMKGQCNKMWYCSSQLHSIQTFQSWNHWRWSEAPNMYREMWGRHRKKRTILTFSSLCPSWVWWSPLPAGPGSARALQQSFSVWTCWARRPGTSSCPPLSSSRPGGASSDGQTSRAAIVRQTMLLGY